MLYGPQWHFDLTLMLDHQWVADYWWSYHQ